MKKILLFLMTICAFVIVKAQSQVCGQAAIKRWTNEVSPGSQAGTVAPIEIDGSTADWAQYITGPFSYYNQPVPTYQPDPHLTPILDAIGNIQLDGLKGEVGERDRPGQEHRDLRYFAFTYDVKNVFFYFRRPGNNSAQVTLYYFIDINVDGFMRNGEPVIKISYNGGQGTLSMAYFVEDPSSITGSQAIPGSWVSGKGNAMSATVARAGTNNTSEWVVGSADGWQIPGSVVDVPNSDLPAVNTGAGEKVGGFGLTDIYSDGETATGYGAEFVIPWSFFRLYGGYSYPGQGYDPLGYMNVFTWHVSLVGGQSGIEGAEDNAGGCCSGLAVSGQPNVTSNPSFSYAAQWIYRTNIIYTEHRNLNTKVITGNIEIVDPKDGGGFPLTPAGVQAWQITGTADLDCNPATAGLSTSFTYVNTTTDGDGKLHYIFAPSSIANATVLLPANLSGCYYLDINTAFAGNPMKTMTVSYAYTTEFDISSNSCNNISNGGSTGNLEVLPVKFVYFNAARSGQNVNLTWQTASEENNTGFEIQRLTGAGDWQNVGFVSTKAVNGNSGIPLNYQFTDINITKGITQYRLKQIDKDYRSAYSVIRSVRGVGQKSNTIIYPNPSGDGKVSVVFENANSIHDVSLMDVSGKTLKQWKGVTNNNIQIDNLNAGFYTVRIVNVETGEQVVEKFIVNKR
jgi:hypothetical protein